MPNQRGRTYRGLLLVMLLCAPAASAEPPQQDDDAPRPHEQPELRAVVPEILRVDREPLAEDENAWPLLIEAVQRFVPPGEAGVDGEALEPWVHPRQMPPDDTVAVAKRYLDANAATLAKIDESLQRPHARAQMQDGMRQAFPTALNGMRELAGLQLLRAKLAHHAGEDAAAFDELASIQRLAELVGEAGYSQISFTIGLGIDGIVPTHLRTRLEAGRLSDDDLLRTIALLADGPTFEDAAVRTVRAEFWGVFAGAVREFREAGAETVGGVLPDLTPRQLQLLDGHNLVDLAQTLELAAPLYVHYAELATAATLQGDRDPQQVDALKTDLARWADAAQKLLDHLAPPNEAADDDDPAADAPPALTDEQRRRLAEAVDNLGGAWLVTATPPDFSRAWIAARNIRARRHAVLLVIACKLHERETGDLPDSLDELVDTGTLETLPTDPFTGDAMHYAPNRRLIWSIGRDRKNNNATTTPDTHQFQQPDLVWEIP